jgi:hypothetical protein
MPTREALAGRSITSHLLFDLTPTTSLIVSARLLCTWNRIALPKTGNQQRATREVVIYPRRSVPAVGGMLQIYQRRSTLSRFDTCSSLKSIPTFTPFHSSTIFSPSSICSSIISDSYMIEVHSMVINICELPTI